MKEYIQKAKILVEALPYIKEFNGITIVIKYGGSALSEERIKKTIMQDIALMKFVGLNPVIVHGGGHDINKLADRLGLTSHFIDGFRVTNAEMMEVVEMVLTGKINKEITTALSMQGIMTAGISGKDGSVLQAEKLMLNCSDDEFSGKIKKVDITLIKTLMDNDFVPVISPVAVGEDGKSYNVNADLAAVAIASGLKAEKLVFLTDVEGILLDREDSGSVLSRVKINEISDMISNGIISGGMIPKVKSCTDALESGVKRVHILDGRVEHCLLLEIFTRDGIGTMIEF